MKQPIKFQTSADALYGPLKKKTFASALSQFFEEQCPQLGGELTRGVLVERIQMLVEQFYPANTHLHMGQVFWPAVDETESGGWGKPIEKTRLKPIFLDLISYGDIENRLKGMSKRDMRKNVIVRLCQQAKSQGGVLTGADLSMLMQLSAATISKYIREWEKETNTLLPRRGTIHDMGPSLTHKREICRKIIVEGRTIEDTAREIRHSPEAITRYVKDYKRICVCLSAGLSPKETAYAVKVSERLVYEYMNLIKEHQLDISKEGLCLNKEGSIKDEDDVPF